MNHRSLVKPVCIFKEVFDPKVLYAISVEFYTKSEQNEYDIYLFRKILIFRNKNDYLSL